MQPMSAIGLMVAAVAAGSEVGRPSVSDLNGEARTPHVAWANPCAGGRLRALFIVPKNRSREVIELAQRLAMEWPRSPPPPRSSSLLQADTPGASPP